MSDTEAVETTENADTSGTVDSSPPPTEAKKSFKTELLKIPCMRSSLLNGYLGAVVGGLGGFFYTSNVKMGAHLAFASYWIVATASWALCRYDFYKREQMWGNLFQQVEEMRSVKKDEYNIPKAVKNLTKVTDDLDKTEGKNS